MEVVRCVNYVKVVDYLVKKVLKVDLKVQVVEVEHNEVEKNIIEIVDNVLVGNEVANSIVVKEFSIPRLED